MKHPTPKRRKSRSRGRKQHAEFVRRKHVKLNKIMQVQLCPDCGQPKLCQKVCVHCGKYRGRQVISFEKKVEKITKIKA